PTPRPDHLGDHNARPVPADIVHTIGELVSAHRVDEARQAFTRLTADFDDTERDVLRRVVTTLTIRAYPVAVARLRWAADRYPKYRTLILAAMPPPPPP
ncbi:hypothetical protein, partial [Nocardia cerradoensis]|uniref:hypothetical protein n=1 Tax=Nocardia cerradoensis TaxID=85688 RepID=UPI00167AC210